MFFKYYIRLYLYWHIPPWCFWSSTWNNSCTNDQRCYRFISNIKKNTGISVHKEDLKPQARTLKNILQIGIPISLQDGFIQISFIIITIIANQRGLNDAAAVGIVEKIISFVFLVPSSMLSCVSAISAQNIGAGKDDRAYKTLQYATMIAVSFGLVVAVCMQFISNPVVGIFTNDVFVIKMGSQYIRSYIWDCMIAGIHFSFSGYFCAYGKSGISFYIMYCPLC